MSLTASGLVGSASPADAWTKAEPRHRRAHDRSGVLLAALAGLLAVWLGLTAPAVSPVAPTPIAVVNPAPVSVVPSAAATNAPPNGAPTDVPAPAGAGGRGRPRRP